MFVLPSTGPILVELPLTFVGIVWALITVFLWLSSNYNALQSLVDGCVERVLRPACLLMSVLWHPKVKPDQVLIEIQHGNISRLFKSHCRATNSELLLQGIPIAEKKSYPSISLMQSNPIKQHWIFL